jgi:hypothetical protein
MPKLNRPAIPGYTYANPGETSGMSYVPHPDEDVVRSQMSDAGRIRRGLSANAANTANRLRQQEAAGRALLRTGARSLGAASSLAAGYDLGRNIDEATGIGRKMVDKVAGKAVDEAAAPKKKRVQLSEYAKQRQDEEAVDQALRDVDEEDRQKSKKYAEGGSVRGAGVAQRGVKQCKVV